MKLGQVAILLWALTIGVAAVYFLRGTTHEGIDQRRVVQLSPQEKDMVLGEMRQILVAVHGVLTGLSANDMPAVAKAAKSAGMSMAADGSPELLAKLPIEFKALGLGLHRDFDQLSTDVDGGLGKDQVVARMAQITTKCVSCHAAYRLGVGDEVGQRAP